MMTSLTSLSSPTLALLAGIIATAIYGLWWSLLPKPILGIPYNKASANRVFGDVPDLLKYTARCKETLSFLPFMAEKLNSPVSQIFLRPFAKPWVIVSDFREAQDILIRRSHEFERSMFFGDMFRSLLPRNQVHMKTDHVWKAHRRMVVDTMSTPFLNQVAAPQIYTNVLDLVKLWREKIRLASGHPIEVGHDLHMQALDAIWAPAFGTRIGTTESQATFLSTLDSVPLPASKDKPAAVPRASTPAAFDSLVTLNDSFAIPNNSVFPRLAHRFALTFYSYLRSATKHKDALIGNAIAASWEKFNAGAVEDDSKVKCALDLVVQREIQLAKKENRAPQVDTPDVRDDKSSQTPPHSLAPLLTNRVQLFGFMIAGHDTTSTTLCWAVKYLTDNQEAQTRLRESLHKAFPQAVKEGTLPTSEQLAAANIPYLDAVCEESLRVANVGQVIMRTTKCDVQILGHTVPKGHDVMCVLGGPGFLKPGMSIEEGKRSETSQFNKGKYGEVWDPSTAHLFLPTRWLSPTNATKSPPRISTEEEEEEEEEEVFNPRAGPFLAFGAGPRGCFGKKLAYVQLRLALGLLIWNFELMGVPQELAGWGAVDVLTRVPQQCFLRLRDVGAAEGRKYES